MAGVLGLAPELQSEPTPNALAVDVVSTAAELLTLVTATDGDVCQCEPDELMALAASLYAAADQVTGFAAVAHSMRTELERQRVVAEAECPY